MRTRTSGIALALLLAAGCGASPEDAYTVESVAKSPAAAAFKSPAEVTTVERGSMAGMMGSGVAASETKSEPIPPAETIAGAPDVTRKIIYNADLALVVEDFAKTQPKVEDLVQQADGYIAEMQILGSPGEKRSARWKIRVPVEGFETFLRDVARLGEIEKNSRTSEDVTDRYYDIEARVKNKTVEEERLQKILEDATGKIEEVLQVERELTRVRGEIEQLQGTLRVLANLSSLTTVNLSIREREDYNPPPPIAPSFATTVSRTFEKSLNLLIELGKALVLIVVALSVWLPLVALAALVLFLMVRRSTRPQPHPRPTPAS